MPVSEIKIISNFMPDEEIDKTIALINNSKTYAFKNNPEARIVPLRESEKEATALVKKYANKLLAEQPVQPLYSVEGFLSLWPTGAFADVHKDNHYGFEYLSHTALVYINDDYEGGEIYFPNFDFEYKPKRGDAILFPCNRDEFMHGVKEVTKGNRYTIAIWYCSLKEKEHPLLS
jgi:hypothetical protein